MLAYPCCDANIINQPSTHSTVHFSLSKKSSSVLKDGRYIPSPQFEAALQSSYSHLSQSEVPDNAMIHVITEDESANFISSFVHELNFLNCSSSFLIHIKFEGMLIQDCQNRDMVVESSIIVYNYGMLYKSLATTEPKTETSLQRLKRASELFGLAFAVLQNPCQDFYGMLEMLSLSILVRCCLADCACMLGLEQEEKEYYSKMIVLRDYLSKEHYRLGALMSDAAAAAA